MPILHAVLVTSLMWACLKGKSDIVSLLLKRGDVDTNVKNKAGSTALDVAHKCEMIDVVRLLEDHADHIPKKRKLG